MTKRVARSSFSRRALMLLSILAALAFLAALPAAPAVAAEQSVADAMDAFEDVVEEQMEAWQTPGLAVAVVKDGKMVYARGFGYRDQSEALDVTAETLFPIGSCTKAFTGTALAVLAADGKFDLDAPVQNYIPWFRMVDPAASAGVTARDMLLHRTGLPRYDSFLAMRPDLSRKELVQALRYLEPNKPFRYGFEYDNIMYTSAGFVLEQVAKTTWEDFVRERLFKPLGMSPAFFSVEELKKDPNAAKPYMLKDGRVQEVPYDNLDAIGPAGAIITNVKEMAKWIACNLDAGKVDGKEVVPASALAEAQRPQILPFVPSPRPETPILAYGLGWGVAAYRGHVMLTHEGETDGFRASVSMLPRDNLGVVVLTNRSGHNDLAKYAGFFILDRLLGLDPVDWSGQALRVLAEKNKADDAEAQALEAALAKNESPCRPLADYAGKYENPAYGPAAITVDGDGLSATLGGVTAALALRKYDIFVVQGGKWDGVVLRFATNDAGAVGSVSSPLEQGIPDIVFTRVAETKEKKKKK